jgi:hypothetical protein
MSNNPFSTDALLPNASTYPVVKGGPGSGRHKEDFRIEANSELSRYRQAIGRSMPTPAVQAVKDDNGNVLYYEFSNNERNKGYISPNKDENYDAYTMTPAGDVEVADYAVLLDARNGTYWEPSDTYDTEVDYDFYLPDEINDIMTDLANDGKYETNGIYSVRTDSLIEGFTNFSFSESGKEEDAPKELTPNSWVFGDNTKGERVPICTAGQVLHFAYTGGVKGSSGSWIDAKATDYAEARREDDRYFKEPDDY